MKPRIGYFSDSYASCIWFLLLSLLLSRISARLANNPVTSAKPVPRNEPVEGSGSFGGDESHEEQEWHASGMNPDDEPGDDDDERREGSGDIVEGSGASVHNIVSKMPEDHITTIQSTSLQTTTETHFIIHSQTSTTRSPIYVTPSTSSTTTTTTTVKPFVQYTTTTSTVTTTTRKHAVVVNTRPSTSQADTPYISEIEQPFEMLKPGIFAAVSGGAVVGVLMTILLIMFIIYRMRKKDEGSYSLDEPHQPPNYSYAYQKASTKEFYA